MTPYMLAYNLVMLHRADEILVSTERTLPNEKEILHRQNKIIRTVAEDCGVSHQYATRVVTKVLRERRREEQRNASQ